MKNNFDKKLLTKIKDILLKKSEGYFYNEEILEYQHKGEEKVTSNQISFSDLDSTNGKQKEDPSLVLTKKKVTTHYIPPDLLALKMFIEIFGEKVKDDDLSNLTDSELEQLKTEIINKLQSD